MRTPTFLVNVCLSKGFLIPENLSLLKDVETTAILNYTFLAKCCSSHIFIKVLFHL
ncbi:hypothetical protein LEP1GSC008_3615 [Leptospira kirschneri serovar Bulgarica str. Nikolaevo]|uniref:Uncharacterized protein n=1 Tax=Leptospira kirschneri serovar Bulgarica str. Nikolaevo TaxID=1240687 RepID=M6FG88_9LEPT|nr:hypothetical protein LEP1GSC008_3615 [Leptospira kirschneri serovar Bulgarica str. Nikolaevo]